jgi:putative transposase
MHVGAFRRHAYAVPRDRRGSFEPQLVPKGETRFDDFDHRICSLYAHGMTVVPSRM